MVVATCRRQACGLEVRSKGEDLNRLYVYIISIIAILVIAQCPHLRADDPNSYVMLDFDDLLDGAVYTENDIFQTSIATVTVEPLLLPGQGQSQDPNQYINVADTNFAGGTGNEIGEIRNLSMDFDFGVSVDSLEFLFYQHSPLLNIYVNGEMVIFDHFEDINDFNIGGAAVSVTSNNPNQGSITLTGTIYSFKVGGAQLLIDDMAVTLAGVTTYYVDVDGDDDENTGLDKTSAFKTIQKEYMLLWPQVPYRGPVKSPTLKTNYTKIFIYYKINTIIKIKQYLPFNSFNV